MSGHERERLAAYLDRELAPVERREVEAHLAACAECAALLEQLAAVDAHAVGLEAEAPEGYFDDFASRVRARIESAPLPRRRGLPAWTWAAAAALLLAVVTPLTWRESRAPALDEATPDLRPVTPGLAAPPSGTAPAPRAANTAAEERRRDEARFASEAPKPHPEAAPPQAAPPAPAAPAPGPDQQLADAVFGPEEKLEVSGGIAEAPAALPPEGAVREKGGRRAAVGETRLDAASTSGPGGAFRRLEALQPESLAEWRAAREAWREFAATHADGPRADEARVRAIEAGGEVLSAGGSAEDAALLRRDAAEYLARTDARQKQRVRRLLAELDPAR